jgi:Ser-tRNA(Ala) deacylase AlaX
MTKTSNPDKLLIEHVAKALYCQHNDPLDHNLTREDLNRMAEAAIDAVQSYKHSLPAARGCKDCQLWVIPEIDTCPNCGKHIPTMIRGEE